MMTTYFSNIPKGKMVLWCYLIWYLVTLAFYFDPTISIWVNSLGISLVIGFALMLSVARGDGSRPDAWQTFRLFMMPFGVSSFSSLIKGKGYLLILPPRPLEQLVSIGACLLFVILVGALKTVNKKSLA